jgi:4-aminobutyrate aminotransferase-like enzyme
MSPGPDTRRAELMERRLRLLGPAYRHFYEDPVEIVRGEGTRLFDADGREYLDAYNNVPCVGHAHPRVVAAVSEQAGRLNTHTRYLAEPILAYSERLLASLGEPLDHVMYTNSGSEANDLALRIARFSTGRSGVVVTANAYHGVTTASAEISPSLGARVAPGPAVRTIAPPAVDAVDPDAEGERMARDLAAAVTDLEAAGHGFAAFVCDTVFSSDGIRTDPTGFLGPVAAEVARRGGVFVADEVQAGFARTGESFWGFRRHGIEPDLVTLGKPMGNGMPIGAVACRAALVDRFGRETRYFSTFGGNSVCIAAAAAVLDVIEEEGLAESAGVVGAHLGEALDSLVGRYPLLADPRGAGLFAAATVVGETAPETAGRILNGLRDHGVLIGVTGPGGDVLKIRPPLTFSDSDVDLLAATLDEVLSSATDVSAVR